MKTQNSGEKEIQRAVDALNASEHNPIEWAPVIKFVAPIIARIAAEYAVRVMSKRIGRPVSPATRKVVIEGAANKLAEIAIKRTAKKPKTSGK